MRKMLGAVATLMLWACGGAGGAPESAPKTEGLSLSTEPGVTQGSFVRTGAEVTFSSREVESGVYRLELRLHGMTLTGLLDPANGVSTMDGFADGNAQDTQLLDADRELVSALYAELNTALPAGDAAAPEAMYLRRAVGLWAENPTTVELKRLVMGEQGRGYTMLCSYAKCNGKFTGSCGGVYNWYSYAKHDCNKGGFDWAGNQQIAQLGDHTSCSGDEYYLSGSTWLCGEPDHWSRPKVMGICWGRCGGGCGGDTQYTLDATNHDGCVRNGHMLASAYCDDQFVSASDDELFAPNCY
ncbi:hypothetical protein DRW03_16280 [Corallococcus sp. H22C18031201]|uniref:hypothetical protein n=1 Tax=Citreicoccus inhibens TaxID=2849499 RepID=UPI000E72249C|nr:hypothetical protein [Citreicoccus inhibens]MBU8896819.1 hypothetical protein [Citreicoccus inhibens]RJS21885.1 hypothetical protein DRW03_16280 [Corallococcus sp. H22C18031201]